MSAKSVTAKIAKDLHPLKVSTYMCLLPENNTEKVQHFGHGILHSTNGATQALVQKFKKLLFIGKLITRVYREKTTQSRIFRPCNFSSCRVTVTSFNKMLTWFYGHRISRHDYYYFLTKETNQRLLTAIQGTEAPCSSLILLKCMSSPSCSILY